MTEKKRWKFMKIPAYVWYDYKWLLLAAAVVLFVVIHSLTAALSQKETVLSVMLIDSRAQTGSGQMESDYMQEAGLDGSKQQVQIVSNLMFSSTDSGSYAMTSLSRFLADIGSEKVDVCAMLEEDFLKYNGSGTWMDLGELFDEQELDALSGQFVMQGDKRIGLRSDTLPVLAAYGCYTEDPESNAAVGVIYNTPHPDAARAYLLYLAGLAAEHTGNTYTRERN